MCVCVCFSLTPSHHSGNKPVRLFADGGARNNPGPRPHALASRLPVFFFACVCVCLCVSSTPTLITAPGYKNSHTHAERILSPLHIDSIHAKSS